MRARHFLPQPGSSPTVKMIWHIKKRQAFHTEVVKNAQMVWNTKKKASESIWCVVKSGFKLGKIDHIPSANCTKFSVSKNQSLRRFYVCCCFIYRIHWWQCVIGCRYYTNICISALAMISRKYFLNWLPWWHHVIKIGPPESWMFFCCWNMTHAQLSQVIDVSVYFINFISNFI